MAKAPKDQKKAVSEIEVEPDAWERFRRAIRVAVKAGPQHRKAKTKTKRKRIAAAVAALLVLVGAPLSAHCATWLRCTPDKESESTLDPRAIGRAAAAGDYSSKAPVFYRVPLDADLAKVFIDVISGSTLYSYDAVVQAISPLDKARVEPNIILLNPGVSGSYINRQTGAYMLILVNEGKDDTTVFSRVEGTCTAISPQPLAPNKF
jgi:hypothetical protein